MDIENKNVAIFGLGIEGLALVDFLKDKNCRITLFDQKSEDELLKSAEGDIKVKIESAISDPDITCRLGNNENDLSGFDIIFRSPGINPNNSDIVKARSAGVEISSQIKLFFDLCPCKIIGVTGTKGKGTTASLIYSILKKNYQPPTTDYQPNAYLAGNIGTPAITLIPELKSDDIVILELSSFQLIDLEKSPHIAVVTNLDVDHLDYHKDAEEYRKAKFNILAHQTSGDSAVLNLESTFTQDWISKLESSNEYFSGFDKKAKAFIENEDGLDRVMLNKEGLRVKICDQNGIKLLGKHNLQNIAAAAITADILGVDPKIITEAVSNFAGLPHRLEPVGEIDNVKYINDSFATNPGPTMAAIDSFDQSKILILGGSSKGADFARLAEKIAQNKVRAVVLIGDEADKIKRALLKKDYEGKILSGGNTMAQIVATAKNIAESGDIVVFSPACASFDMFKNYKDRGEQFKSSIALLASQS